MREVKFRAWDTLNDEMVSYCELSTSELGEVFGNEDLEILQFTGLLDKNGVEIYEEDFIKDKDCIFVIKWQAGGFVLSPIKYSKHVPYLGRQVVELQNAQYISESCEVIGNIYEEKELLNEEL